MEMRIANEMGKNYTVDTPSNKVCWINNIECTHQDVYGCVVDIGIEIKSLTREALWVFCLS